MDYNKVIYNNYAKSSYPLELVKHIKQKYFIYRNTLVLDLGCGKEIYTRAFETFGFSCKGIDRGWENKIHNLPGDFERDKLPFSDRKFDYIFCKSVIEHVRNTEHLLAEAYRVLKKNGKILILTPSWENNYKWFYDDPTHIKPFCRKGLQDALKMADFKNIEVEYFYHLPFIWKKHSFLGRFLATVIRKILPDKWRWRDCEQKHHNVLIRFSKEVQLLAIGQK